MREIAENHGISIDRADFPSLIQECEANGFGRWFTLRDEELSFSHFEEEEERYFGVDFPRRGFARFTEYAVRECFRTYLNFVSSSESASVKDPAFLKKLQKTGRQSGCMDLDDILVLMVVLEYVLYRQNGMLASFFKLDRYIDCGYVNADETVFSDPHLRELSLAETKFIPSFASLSDMNPNGDDYHSYFQFLPTTYYDWDFVQYFCSRMEDLALAREGKIVQKFRYYCTPYSIQKDHMVYLYYFEEKSSGALLIGTPVLIYDKSKRDEFAFDTMTFFAYFGSMEEFVERKKKEPHFIARIFRAVLDEFDGRYVIRSNAQFSTLLALTDEELIYDGSFPFASKADSILDEEEAAYAGLPLAELVKMVEAGEDISSYLVGASEIEKSDIKDTISLEELADAELREQQHRIIQEEIAISMEEMDEDEKSEGDVTEFFLHPENGKAIIRNVYCYPRLNKEIGRLTEKDLRKLKDYILAFQTMPHEELVSFHRSKKMKGVENPVYKIYFEYSGSARRLSYCYLSDYADRVILPEEMKDAILLLAISDHEEQGKDVRKIKTNAIEEFIRDIDTSRDGVYVALRKILTRTQRKSDTNDKPFFAPLETDRQKEFCADLAGIFNQNDSVNALLRGVAGSGKTTVVLNAFNSLLKLKEAGSFNTPTEVFLLTYTGNLLTTMREQEEAYANAENVDYAYASDHMLTLREFFLEQSGLPEGQIRIKEYEDFLDYVHSYQAGTPPTYQGTRVNFLNIFPTDSECERFWMMYRGTIKGKLTSSFRGTADRDVFLLEMKRNENETLFRATPEVYYMIACWFDEWFEDRYAKEYDKRGNVTAEYYCVDDNDLAFAALDAVQRKKKRPRYLILVDEAQDLTKVQADILKEMTAFYAYERAKPSYALIAAGDINQRINPTTVRSLSEISASKKPSFLDKTFRCGQEIINFINSLIEIRQVCFAAQDEGSDNRIRPVEEIAKYWKDGKEGEIDDHSVLTYFESIKDENEFIELLQSVEEKFDCAVIVATDKTKKRLQERIPLMRDDIFTIQESKGREWSSVFLYDMVYDYKDVFEHILSSRGSCDTFERLIFNYLYVGATRASRWLYIAETDGKSSPMKEIYASFADQHTDRDVMLRFMSEDSKNRTARDYYLLALAEKARAFKNRDSFLRVSTRLMRAESLEHSPELEVEIARQKQAIDALNVALMVYKDRQTPIAEKATYLFQESATYLFNLKLYDDVRAIYGWVKLLLGRGYADFAQKHDTFAHIYIDYLDEKIGKEEQLYKRMLPLLKNPANYERYSDEFLLELLHMAKAAQSKAIKQWNNRNGRKTNGRK